MSSINNQVILHLTSLSTGGGGRVTMDIHRACLGFGYESYVIYRGKTVFSPDGSVIKINNRRKLYWNKLRRYIFRKIARHAWIDDKYSMYNLCERFTCYSAKDLLSAIPSIPSIVFVHWVSDFANAEVIHQIAALTGAKIVFVMVDHALFSGGCHYQFDCQGFKSGCHQCPATNSHFIRIAIEKNYAFKKKYLSDDYYVAARGVDKLRLRESDIYRNFHQELVVFPLDEQKYCPSVNKHKLRLKWGIQESQKVVLLGATSLNEKRKGMDLFLRAITLIRNDVVFIVAGNMKDPLPLPENVIITGLLDENRLIEAYQLSDTFVCPSLADAGPLMVKQACLCGTPVVAFPVGVSVELVETGQTGYLASYGDVNDLAKGIDTIVSLSSLEWEQMSSKCRERAVNLFSFQAGHSIDDLIKRLN